MREVNLEARQAFWCVGFGLGVNAKFSVSATIVRPPFSVRSRMLHQNVTENPKYCPIQNGIMIFVFFKSENAKLQLAVIHIKRDSLCDTKYDISKLKCQHSGLAAVLLTFQLREIINDYRSTVVHHLYYYAG